MFPDWLFRLAVEDEQSQVLSIWDRRASVTANSQFPSVFLEAIPNDRFVIVTNLYMDGAPDSGDQLNGLTCQKVPAGGGANLVIYRGPSDSGSFINDLPVWARWQGYYLLAPGEQLECVGSYNAVATVTHITRFYAQGIIIPRGNIVQG